MGGSFTYGEISELSSARNKSGIDPDRRAGGGSRSTAPFDSYNLCSRG
jgi:hypothetical protein